MGVLTGSNTDAEKLELSASVEEEMRTVTRKTREVRVSSSEEGQEGILSLPTAWGRGVGWRSPLTATAFPVSTVSCIKMLPSCARKITQKLYVAQKLQSRGQCSAVTPPFPPALCSALMHSRPGPLGQAGEGV